MKRLFVALGVALLPFIALLAFFSLRPPADSVTPQEIARQLESGYMQVDRAEGYCELQGTEEFAVLFDVENWKKIGYSAQNPVLTLEFSEEYYLYLYENGVVQAYDGYASPTKKGSVYYETGADVQAILDCVERYAVTENFRLRWQG